MKITRKNDNKETTRVDSVLFGSVVRYQRSLYILAEVDEHFKNNQIMLIDLDTGKPHVVPFSTQIEPIDDAVLVYG